MLEMAFAAVWVVSLLYIVRFLAFAVAVYRSRYTFRFPSASSLKAYPIVESPVSKHPTLARETEVLADLGFTALYDIHDTTTGTHRGRLLLDEDGTLAMLGLTGFDADSSRAWVKLVTRLQNGYKLCTTNTRSFSRWRDNLGDRKTAVLPSDTTTLSAYGEHMVLVQSATQDVHPYLAEQVVEEMQTESEAEFDGLVEKGYFRYVTQQDCFVPKLRGYVAYTLGLTSPGILGVIALGTAVFMTFLFPLVLFFPRAF